MLVAGAVSRHTWHPAGRAASTAQRPFQHSANQPESPAAARWGPSGDSGTRWEASTFTSNKGRDLLVTHSTPAPVSSKLWVTSDSSQSV